jgi:kynurenine 3-monooxygenase
MAQSERLIIIGAGLAGSLLAATLARKGFMIDVYERRDDMRRISMSAGRSINLALSARGLNALQHVGLDEEILQLSIPMRGRMMHATDGSTTFQPYGRLPHEMIYSVSRAELNKRLMDHAEARSGVTFHFGHRCDTMDIESGEVTFTVERSGDTVREAGAPVIATDGAGSAIRDAMVNAGECTVTQDFLEHGYKELTIPPSSDGGFQLEANALHIWPRHSYMMIALPNPDYTFTCTLFLQNEGEPSFESLNTGEAVLSFFERQFPDALALMPTLVEDFFRNPTGMLGTVRCLPWHRAGQSLLIGDAAHAIVPFFGQGMNCAFEDVVEVHRCIDEYGTEWETIFAEVQRRRKRNADAIATMALENFVEMRDHVADEGFLFMKKAGLALEERFPEYFIPKYSMVSFNLIPYAAAFERAAIQQRILETLTRNISRIEDIDMELAQQLITTSLRPFKEDAGF